MIRRCQKADVADVLAIINDAARAYQGVIPTDRWHEPYMPLAELEGEIADGVEFWGYEEQGALLGVMGIQDKGDVCLIRHAYVRPQRQQAGIGTRLLRHLESMTEKPILIGTWAAAAWAVAFYQRNGYRLLSPRPKRTACSGPTGEFPSGRSKRRWCWPTGNGPPSAIPMLGWQFNGRPSRGLIFPAHRVDNRSTWRAARCDSPRGVHVSNPFH